MQHNLGDAIAQGHASKALLENLVRRERELQDLDAALLSDHEDGIPAKIGQVEKFIRDRLPDLRRLSAKNAVAAKAELVKHCDSIWVTPEEEGYTVGGKWNLAAGRSDGAGGPDRTLVLVA